MTVPYTFATATSPIPLSQLDANFAALSNATAITYNQGSTNAVNRTVTSKLQEYVSVKDFGAVGNNIADDTVAIQNCFTYCGANGYTAFFPEGQYLISSGLTFTGNGGIWMESAGYGGGTAGDYAIYPTGSGYTALTLNGTINCLNIALGGGGQTLNGIYWNNSQISTVNKIRVYNFNGFGLRLDKCYDSIFFSISIELCGNTSSTTLNTYSYPNYAFGMFDAGDTCNMSHIARLQVEQANSQAIYVSGNTLSCLFDNIHSERANGTNGYTTWNLGGNRCRYNVGRYEANNPTVANMNIEGSNSTFANLLVEGAITVSAEGGNGTPITIETPEIQGTLQAVSNQTGYITLIGGTVINLNSQSLGWKIFSTTITTLTIDYSGGTDPKQFEAFGCNIGTIASGSTNSSATFNDCTINNLTSNSSGGYGLQGNTVFNDSNITCSNTYTIAYATTYFNNSIVNANTATNNGSIIAKGTVFNGTLSLTAGSITSTFDDSTYATGTVSGFGAPTGGTWYKGAYTKNIAPAIGSPKAWVCTAFGTPGTWVSEGNL